MAREKDPWNIVKTPLGDAAQVPIQTFIDAFLPPLDDRVNYDALMEDGAGKELIAGNGHMWGYKLKNPSDMTPDRAFQPLQSCAAKFARFIQEGNPSCRFFNRATRRSSVEEEELSASSPDACLVVGRNTKDIPANPWSSSPPSAHPDVCREGDSEDGSSACPSRFKQAPEGGIDWTVIVASGAYSQGHTTASAEDVSIHLSYLLHLMYHFAERGQGSPVHVGMHATGSATPIHVWIFCGGLRHAILVQ